MPADRSSKGQRVQAQVRLTILPRNLVVSNHQHSQRDRSQSFTIPITREMLNRPMVTRPVFGEDHQL